MLFQPAAVLSLIIDGPNGQTTANVVPDTARSTVVDRLGNLTTVTYKIQPSAPPQHSAPALRRQAVIDSVLGVVSEQSAYKFVNQLSVKPPANAVSLVNNGVFHGNGFLCAIGPHHYFVSASHCVHGK